MGWVGPGRRRRSLWLRGGEGSLGELGVGKDVVCVVVVMVSWLSGYVRVRDGVCGRACARACSLGTRDIKRVL